MPLAITDVTDKEQIAVVAEGRAICKKLRVGVEKMGKAARDGFNKAAKDVITQERRLTDPISEIEAHLEAELAKVKAEEDRKKREAEEARQAMIRERLQQLQACGKSYLAEDVHELTDEDFASLLAAEQADKKARDEQAAADEAERKRIEEANRVEAERLSKEKAELERKQKEQDERLQRADARIQMLNQQGYSHSFGPYQLADMPPHIWEQLLENARRQKADRDRAAEEERAKLDRQREEQAAAQAKIDAENKRIADEQAAKDRAAELETAKAAAAEQAQLDAIADQKRQDAEAKAAAEAEAAELARLESLRPDHEKLLAVAVQIETVIVPALTGQSKTAADSIRTIRNEAADQIRAVANSLVAKKPRRRPALAGK
jgi:fused signal recognition particle receptor